MIQVQVQFLGLNSLLRLTGRELRLSIQRERESIRIKEKDNDLVCAFSGRKFILKFDILDWAKLQK